MSAISDVLKVPILIFQSCDNLAGYSMVNCAMPTFQDEEQCTRFKIICLTKNKKFYDSLVAADLKDNEFQNRLMEFLKMKVTRCLHYNYVILILYYFILASYR